MVSLVLTLMADDRPGLVSAVSGPVEACGGSWQRSQLASLAGKFAGIALVSVPQDAVADLQRELAALSGQGLQVSVTRADGVTTEAPSSAVSAPDRAQPAAPATWSLHLVGQDRPGIVAEISAVLTRHGVGIDELRTDVLDTPMAGGMLFEAFAQLSLLSGVDVELVQTELEQLAQELMVDLDVHPGAG